MAKRLELHEELCDILNSKNAYFQPPESGKMKYPAIIYNLREYDQRRADDINYTVQAEYTLTIIDRDPDSTLPTKVLSRFKMCRFDRWYAADGLNHYVFDLFY